MKPPEKLADWLLVAFLIGQAMMTIYIFQHQGAQKRTLNCDLSEFHPDFTPEMKKQCRTPKPERML